jgi:hypothetical protein
MEELTPEQRMHLDALSEEYYRHYGIAIEFLKARVGEGQEYTNSVARAIVSQNGAWLELMDLPLEFSGMVGEDVEQHFITNEEAMRLLDRLHTTIEEITAENTRHFHLFVLYQRTGIIDSRGIFIYQHALQRDGSPLRPTQIGRCQPQRLPLLFRCRMDTDIEIEAIPFQRGSLFCLTQVGERNLLVWMSHEGGELHDLGNIPLNPVEH